MRRLLATAALAATAAAVFTAAPAQAVSCTNEQGDIYVLNLVGVDYPGDNRRYAVCVLDGAYGIAIDEDPGGSTCVALIVNDGYIGGC